MVFLQSCPAWNPKGCGPTQRVEVDKVTDANKLNQMTVWQQLLSLGGALLLCYTAAAIGGLASVTAEDFYALLDRPTWAPPAWLFGPVWSVLYTLIGISSWLVWKNSRFTVRLPYVILIAQLLANALWSWLFFVWQLGLAAVLEIALLWLLIVMNIVAFHRQSATAAILLLPYLCWVSFAAMLTIALWLANPSLL